MLNLSASRHSCLPTPIHTVRATPGESADLVINQLFGSLSGSGHADSFQDFLSQLFSKNVLDKADTQFSGTEEVPSVGAGEHGTHCESQFSKMLSLLLSVPPKHLMRPRLRESPFVLFFSSDLIQSSKSFIMLRNACQFICTLLNAFSVPPEKINSHTSTIISLFSS